MRELKGPSLWLVLALGAGAALFHLWTAGFGFFEPREQRSLHLLLLLPLAFLLFPATARSPRDRPSALDWALAALAILPNLYSYHCANGARFCSSAINMRFENVDPVTNLEFTMGILAVVLVIEAIRRAVAPVLAGLISLGVAYLFVSDYMPGLLHYRPMPAREIIENLYLLNGMGIYGSITGISATIIAMFIIFGAFVEGSGIGRLFQNVGLRLAGRQTGGPAKVAVVSSSLFGTISGSSVANVFTTGSFTIPSMIRAGYRRPFAGGVEAASSVGGQIMPPVMGAGAFVMAEITNTPYATIAISALLGSVLYFFMLLVSVHLEARRLRLSGCDPSEIPSWREILRDLHLLAPILLLVSLLAWGYSPHYAAFMAVLSVWPTTWLRRHTRLGPPAVLRILATSGRNMVMVALACAGAGMFVTSLTVTGMVISFSSVVTGLAGTSVYLAGLLLMVTTLILGMGVPTTAAYIIGAAIGAPILIQMGVPLLGAHMFVFYFAILADATPPVSVASYAAASIARSGPLATGFSAFRLASAGFVVGYSYIHTQALLLQDTAFGIAGEFLVNALALTLMAAGYFGHFRADIGLALRVLLVPTGLVLALADPIPVWWRVAMLAAICLGLAAYQRRAEPLGAQPRPAPTPP